MLAASYWSLLAPAIEISERGATPSWFPPAIGFLLGGAVLWVFDKSLPHLHLGFPIEEAEGPPTTWHRAVLLVTAITLHNIPEGLAVGVAFGAGWVPCIGPILGAILTLAATRANMAEGVGLLFVYSLGLAVPFVLSAVALTAFLAWFRRFRRYIRYVEWVAGILLICVGLLLASGKFTVLAGWLIRFTPEFLMERI